MKGAACSSGSLVGLVALAVLAFIPGGAKEELRGRRASSSSSPSSSCPTIGPVDLSITKAVIYLWIATAVIVVVAVVISRILKPQPGRFQYAHRDALRARPRRHRRLRHEERAGDTWFPYIGGRLLLRARLQPHRSHPAALRRASPVRALRRHGQPVRHRHAGALHVRVHALRRHPQATALHYFANWAPASAPPVLKQFIFVIHAVSEIFRLVSLSVRLFANMLAGHAILGVFFAMALIFQSYLAALVLQGGSVLIYLFEIFVAVIQAFIFAILSAVYIGGALDQEH